MTDPRITRRDFQIGDWTEDGETYRAVYVGEVRLTGPEHAHLSDADLMREAIAEAQRGNILANAAAFADHEGHTFCPDCWSGDDEPEHTYRDGDAALSGVLCDGCGEKLAA